MNSKGKTVLTIGVLATSTWFYFQVRKPNPPPPKQEPSYSVMGKKFIDRPPSYYIQYDLVGGEDGEVIAECDDPRTDGTGCEKFKTLGTYTLYKDDSGRFLIDRTSPGVRLAIKTEGLWPNENTDTHKSDPSLGDE